METGSGSPLTARAKFKFEGTNNDELSFDKNDLITITQQQEGGWWEGTLDKTTGWFPCAYVTIVTEKDPLLRSKSIPNTAVIENGGKQTDYRAEVLVNYAKNEKEYIDSLARTMTTLLLPIGKSGSITAKDYDLLVGNFEEIYTTQNSLLKAVENQAQFELPKQKIGGAFLSSAAELRSALVKYADNYPEAVRIMEKKQKDLEKIAKENGRDGKELISGLYEPLRHLDKYHIMLQELERSVPENHLDRGDLQRSAAVFRETKDICETAKKQKTSQMDFIAFSDIEKSVSANELGTILHVGEADVEFGQKEAVNRFVGLFSKCIAFAEVISNKYQVKERFPLAGFTLKKLEGNEFILEKSGGPAIKVTFESQGWMTSFAKVDNLNILSTTDPTSGLTRRPSKSAAENEYSLISKPPPPPGSELHVLRRKSSKNSEENQINISGSGKALKFDHELGMVLPDGFTLPKSGRNSKETAENIHLSQFPSYFLSGNANRRNDKGFKMRKDVARDEEIEFETLKIIEGYCVETNGASDHYFSGNENHHAPQLIVAEDEKILVEEIVNDEVVLQEKSIVDAVYSIKDQLSEVQNEVKNLTKIVEAEQKARRRLEHNYSKLSGVASPDGSTSTPRKAINSTES